MGEKGSCSFVAALFAISGLFSALPRTFEQFLIARLISGVGIGASSVVCPVLYRRDRAGKIAWPPGDVFQLGIVTGIFLTLFINKLIQGMGDEAWNVASGWRWMLGMEVVPALIFIGLLFTVPESPRWLAQQGRSDEARAILVRVGGDEHAGIELAAVQSVAGKVGGSLSDLFTRDYFDFYSLPWC